jgi:hypothetical protein
MKTNDLYIATFDENIALLDKVGVTVKWKKNLAFILIERRLEFTPLLNFRPKAAVICSGGLLKESSRMPPAGLSMVRGTAGKYA